MISASLNQKSQGEKRILPSLIRRSVIAISFKSGGVRKGINGRTARQDYNWSWSEKELQTVDGNDTLVNGGQRRTNQSSRSSERMTMWIVNLTISLPKGQNDSMTRMTAGRMVLAESSCIILLLLLLLIMICHMLRRFPFIAFLLVIYDDIQTVSHGSLSPSAHNQKVADP